jgi:hypothetical protein
VLSDVLLYSLTELNSRGNVGWELVSVREYNKTSDSTDADQSIGKLVTEYIFKRKISK